MHVSSRVIRPRPEIFARGGLHLEADVSPILEGSDASLAFLNTVDLAQHAEKWGYHRYWLSRTSPKKVAAILRNGGRIVNMSSVSGQMGLFGQANYSSSKAAIIALTKVSAREFARQNITVNPIAPGFIDVRGGKFQEANSARPPR
jgi:NAD(P)-dependent dehydrogenase (short-subunit alcohol dehydrogenase family)